MKSCCVCGKPPQWHHQFVYGGKAINEAWAILPLCKTHHDQVNHRHFHQLMDWVALNRATDEELEKYSRVMGYKGRRSWLNRQYGEFRSETIAAHYADLVFSN